MSSEGTDGKAKTRTRHSHYLPKLAYLKLFSRADNPTQVWRFFRDGRVLPESLTRAGAQRDLYTTTNIAGMPDDSVEGFLKMIEDWAGPALRTLNCFHHTSHIGNLEHEHLALFTAYQHVRTPAFLESMRNLYLDKHQAEFIKLASNKSEFEALVGRMTSEVPDALNQSPQEIRDFILDKSRYTLGLEDEQNYLIENILRLGHGLANELLDKKIEILTAGDLSYFITSDHPVLIMPIDSSGALNINGGFRHSDVGIAIGPKRFLLFTNSNEKIYQRGGTPIEFTELPVEKVELINRFQIDHAEEYLFGSINDGRLSAAFKGASRTARRKPGQVAPIRVSDIKMLNAFRPS